MNISTEDTIRLINHLTNDESKEEKLIIVESLKNRPELLDEYRKLEKLRIAFKAHSISTKIEAIHQQSRAINRIVYFLKQKTFMIAASVTIIMGFLLFFRNKNETRYYENIYTSYYVSPNLLPNSTSINHDAQLFYKGIYYLENQQLNNAIVLLKQSKHPYASWYLSLAFIKNKENENARKQLKFITKDNTNLFNKKAEDLLKRLDY